MREITEQEQINDFNGRVVKSIIWSKNGINILFENKTELNLVIAFEENKAHVLIDDNDLTLDAAKFEECAKQSAFENGTGLPY